MVDPAGGPRRITAAALTAEGWSPFGWVPVSDTDPADGRRRLEFAWSDPHVNVIGHARDEVPEIGEGLRCSMLYRHATHTQVLMPLDHQCVIAVAPAGLAFDSEEAVLQIRAFVIEPLESMVLNRGTWHWGPFPTTEPVVRLFNVQGLRYAEDNEMVDLASRSMAVDVVLAR
ncbi:MAG: ureidoglycolate lyase [Acidimicrobiales bacterium]